MLKEIIFPKYFRSRIEAARSWLVKLAWIILLFIYWAFVSIVVWALPHLLITAQWSTGLSAATFLVHYVNSADPAIDLNWFGFWDSFLGNGWIDFSRMLRKSLTHMTLFLEYTQSRLVPNAQGCRFLFVSYWDMLSYLRGYPVCNLQDFAIVSDFINHEIISRVLYFAKYSTNLLQYPWLFEDTIRTGHGLSNLVKEINELYLKYQNELLPLSFARAEHDGDLTLLLEYIDRWKWLEIRHKFY